MAELGVGWGRGLLVDWGSTKLRTWPGAGQGPPNHVHLRVRTVTAAWWLLGSSGQAGVETIDNRPGLGAEPGGE